MAQPFEVWGWGCCRHGLWKEGHQGWPGPRDALRMELAGAWLRGQASLGADRSPKTREAGEKGQ